MLVSRLVEILDLNGKNGDIVKVYLFLLDFETMSLILVL